jgi:hypothetical protein
MRGDATFQSVSHLALVGRFVLHTIVGVMLFALVGAAAIVLNYCAGWIAQAGVSTYVGAAIQVLEIFLFAADFLCIIVFVTKETFGFLHAIIASRAY